MARTIIAFLLLAVATSPASADQINVDVDMRPLIAKLTPRKAPVTTCGISTVGYRFVGSAGKRIRYAGDSYAIEDDGDLELIADRRRTTYAVDGRSLPINVWPRDQFGFRVVPVK